MLVLTRKPNEEIRIGDDIVVSIVRVRGNMVRVGIDAPGHVRIMRSELLTEKTESPAAPATIALSSPPTRSATSVDTDEPTTCPGTTAEIHGETPDAPCQAGLSGTTSFARVVARRRKQRWSRVINA